MWASNHGVSSAAIASRAVAVFLLREVGAERALDRREMFLDTGGAHERLPLVQADRDHHDPSPVAGREVAPEGAVHVVAERWTVRVRDLCLPEEAEVGDRRERNVGKRDLHELAVARGAPLALGREQADHGVQAGRDVPRRERVVHREGRADRTGRQRDARRGVHRVVDRGGLVGVADDVDVHEVGPQRA